jgi:uncharacterized protein YjbI with pentapeptide repeats
MKEFSVSMKHRRDFLIAACALFGGGALSACDARGNRISFSNLPGLKNAPSQEEMGMLSNFILRRQRLGERKLKLEGRLFDSNIRMVAFSLENTEFVDCDFMGSTMLEGDLQNVRFTNCLFDASRWDDGSWENVYFTGCVFRGPFNVGPKRGKKSLQFESCTFEGATAKKSGYGGRSEYFGSIGGTEGDVLYDKCAFSRTYINGGSHLTLRDCQMNETVISARDDCQAIFERINAIGVIDVGAGAGNFSSFQIRQSTFADLLTFKGGRIGALILEDVTVDLLLNSLKANSVNLTRVTFICEKKIVKTFQYGLQTESAKIGKMIVSDCVFDGHVPAMYLYGRKDRTDAVKKAAAGRNYVNVYATCIGELVFRNTVVRGRFEYMEIGVLSFESLRIHDSNFSNCKISNLVMRNVNMFGNVEFAGAFIGRRVMEEVADTSTGTRATVLN